MLKDDPSCTGNFSVEFHFPSTPEFQMTKKTVKVDAYQPTKELLEFLFRKLKIEKPHLYEIRDMDNVEIPERDTLSAHGLGTKVKVFQVQVVKRKWMRGTDPVKGKSQDENFDFFKMKS